MRETADQLKVSVPYKNCLLEQCHNFGVQFIKPVDPLMYITLRRCVGTLAGALRFLTVLRDASLNRSIVTRGRYTSGCPALLNGAA